MWIRRIGTILMVGSVVLFAFIYTPIFFQELRYKFFNVSDTVPEPKSSEFGIVIEKLGINEVVTPQVNPFNKDEYLPVLKNSIAHAKDTALPGEEGTVYLFSHSSDNPFSITRYNTAFYLLDRLAPGDKITLYYQGKPYFYKVRELKEVKPWQADALTQSDKRPQLTLQTCTPVGTAINRLLVFADPIISEPS